MQQMGSGSVKQVSQRLGADEQSTEKAMAAALPMLLGALARNSTKPDGAQALYRAVTKDHDGSVVDNLSGFLNNPDLNDGNAILGHILGNRRPAVETGVSKTSGMGGQQVAQLMATLAPIVMGALGRVQRQQKLDASGLGNVLASERQQVERDNPALGGLASLLDQDGDGHIADDLFSKIGKGLLGSLFGGGRR